MRHVEVRPGIYRDSVALMQLSASLTQRPEVEAALVAMATPLNVELLSELGFDAPPGTSPTDLLIAVSTSDLSSILSIVDASLSSSTARSGTESSVSPRTVSSAVRSFEADLVLVSTPGPYAFVEAMDALSAGASVMVFSDNVPVAQEVALKRAATERGLLVMGPDCGTAVVGGVGLGFANVIRPGPVGLVAASGTGAQQVMSLLSFAGAGISHCLGVGGRDLSEAVGALSARAALSMLDADPATERIVLLSKPPAASVASALRSYVDTMATPVLFAPLGPGQPDLTALTGTVLVELGLPVPAWPSWVHASSPSPGSIRGLYSGGTLCTEGQLLAPSRDGDLWLDLGADEYTVGRPHPMIDYGPRLSLLAKHAADPLCRVLLLDVVLGHGALPDPASVLAPAVEAALARSQPLDVVVSLVGTPDDPQGLFRQAEALHAAGASVFLSNAVAVRHALSLVGTP